MKHLTK